MTEQKEKFCLRYVETLNARMSAEDSGYSPATAKQQGWQLLQEEEIQERIQELRTEYNDKFGISKSRVLNEYRKIAFSDIRELYIGDNELADVRQWGDEIASAVSGVDSEEIFTKEGEKIGTTKKVKLHSKLSALDALSKHLGLFEKDNSQKNQPIVINTVPESSGIGE